MLLAEVTLRFVQQDRTSLSLLDFSDDPNGNR